MASFSVPMKVLADTISKGAVESRSRRVLTPEEIAIMIVCTKLNKNNAIDQFIRMWMEGTIRISRSGSWPTGLLHVEIPDTEL